MLPSVTAEPIDARPPSRPATASKSEETKVVASQPSAAPSQTRIQFTDSKAVPAPPTPVTTAPVPAPQKGTNTWPQEIFPALAAPAEEASNPFSRIMGLLSKTDSTDSDDVQLEAIPPPPKYCSAYIQKINLFLDRQQHLNRFWDLFLSIYKKVARQEPVQPSQQQCLELLAERPERKKEATVETAVMMISSIDNKF